MFTNCPPFNQLFHNQNPNSFKAPQNFKVSPHEASSNCISLNEQQRSHLLEYAPVSSQKPFIPQYMTQNLGVSLKSTSQEMALLEEQYFKNEHYLQELQNIQNHIRLHQQQLAKQMNLPYHLDSSQKQYNPLMSPVFSTFTSPSPNQFFQDQALTIQSQNMKEQLIFSQKMQNLQSFEQLQSKDNFNLICNEILNKKRQNNNITFAKIEPPQESLEKSIYSEHNEPFVGKRRQCSESSITSPLSTNIPSQYSQQKDQQQILFHLSDTLQVNQNARQQEQNYNLELLSSKLFNQNKFNSIAPLQRIEPQKTSFNNHQIHSLQEIGKESTESCKFVDEIEVSSSYQKPQVKKEDKQDSISSQKDLSCEQNKEELEKKCKKEIQNESNYTKNLLKGFKRYMNKKLLDQKEEYAKFTSYFYDNTLSNEFILTLLDNSPFTAEFEEFLALDPNWWIKQAKIKDVQKQVSFFEIVRDKNYSEIRTKRKVKPLRPTILTLPQILTSEASQTQHQQADKEENPQNLPLLIQ